ncbi:MAG: hypothetical protein AB1374_11665 [Bacillota bacterium]
MTYIIVPSLCHWDNQPFDPAPEVKAGIQAIEADGSWEGLAQIGNAQWPPHEGDLVDVAASLPK